MSNQKVWDTHYERPRARQAYPDENIVRVLKKEYAGQTGGICLDLGAGSGRHLPLLSEHFKRVVACDFSYTSLKPYAAENFSALQTALPDLPFAAGTFDFILCWGVLHYLPSAMLKPAVAEIARCLKPGGKIFLTLRSDADTHLKAQLKAGDLRDGHADLFSKEEALALFSGFAPVKYGFISRQPLGEEYLVAHHMLLAVRPPASR